MAHVVLTSGGISFIRDWLIGLNPTPPTHIALGSGTVTVGRYMTQLPGETFRTSIVQADASGPCSVVYHAFLGITDDLNHPVGCYGIFAGNATDRPNSGTLIAIGNEPVPFSKNPINTYSLDIELSVSGTVG